MGLFDSDQMVDACFIGDVPAVIGGVPVDVLFDETFDVLNVGARGHETKQIQITMKGYVFNAMTVKPRHGTDVDVKGRHFTINAGAKEDGQGLVLFGLKEVK